MKINLEKFKLKCVKCGYKWIPTREDVKICPRCKSIYWHDKKGGYKTKKWNKHKKALFMVNRA